MGYLDERLKEIEEYYCSNTEEQALSEIVKFVEDKYNVKVHKAVFRYDETQTKIDFVDLYLKTTLEEKTVLFSENKNIWKQQFLEEGKLICDVLKRYNLQFSNVFERGYHILFFSFEQVALYACYAEALKERKKLREKYFNSETMEIIHDFMFVVYKTKRDMEKSEQIGEQARIKEECYQFIKKYDKYNYITREKHLLVHFDYSGHARSPRAYSDLYWDMLE